MSRNILPPNGTVPTVAAGDSKDASLFAGNSSDGLNSGRYRGDSTLTRALNGFSLPTPPTPPAAAPQQVAVVFPVLSPSSATEAATVSSKGTVIQSRPDRRGAMVAGVPGGPAGSYQENGDGKSTGHVYVSMPSNPDVPPVHTNGTEINGTHARLGTKVVKEIAPIQETCATQTVKWVKENGFDILNVGYSGSATFIFVVQAMLRGAGGRKNFHDLSEWSGLERFWAGWDGAHAALQNLPLAYLFAEDAANLVKELKNGKAGGKAGAPKVHWVKKGIIPVAALLGGMNTFASWGSSKLTYQNLGWNDGVVKYFTFINAIYTALTRIVGATQLLWGGFSLARSLRYKKTYGAADNFLSDLQRFGHLVHIPYGRWGMGNHPIGKLSNAEVGLSNEDVEKIATIFYQRLAEQGVSSRYAYAEMALDTIKYGAVAFCSVAALMTLPIWMGNAEKGINEANHGVAWLASLAPLMLYLRSALDLGNIDAAILNTPRIDQKGTPFFGFSKCCKNIFTSVDAKRTLAYLLIILPDLVSAVFSGTALSKNAQSTRTGLTPPWGEVAHDDLLSGHYNPYSMFFNALSPILESTLTLAAAAAVNGRGSVKGMPRLPKIKNYFNRQLEGIDHKNQNSLREFQGLLATRVEYMDLDPKVVGRIGGFRDTWQQRVSRLSRTFFTRAQQADTATATTTPDMDAAAADTTPTSGDESSLAYG